MDGGPTSGGAARGKIAAILPPTVVAVESAGEHRGAPLMPEEEAALGNVVETRRTEFSAGRDCARRALEMLGFPRRPVLPGPRRQPLWPAGVVGSITHCEGYRAAAVARDEDFLAIGIDAEPHAPLPHGVLELVALPEEREWLRALADAGVAWDRVLFSAKESVYKAWFPAMESWLDFRDAAVTLDVQRGAFRARLLVPEPPAGALRIGQVEGRFSVDGDVVLTFAGIPHRDGSGVRPRAG